MHTTPRTVIDDFNKVFRRIFFQEFAIIRDLGEVVPVNFVQRVRKRHFSAVMMVTVAFAVGGNVDQLRSLPGIRKPAHQAIGKSFPII